MTDAFDEIFSGLSADPYMASFELLQRVRAQFLQGQPKEAEYSAACGVFEAFYEANGWKLPEPVSGGTYSGIDDSIARSRSTNRLQFEGYQMQIMAMYRIVMKRKASDALKASTATAVGYAILDADEKSAIHQHIETIRKIIESSKLKDSKKNGLFDRLGELSSEVNRNGTRTDRFFAFASEVAFSARDFEQNARPMFDQVKDILRIVTRARARHEGIKLPANEEVLSLPEPEFKDE
jgi:hypothetical protein